MTTESDDIQQGIDQAARGEVVKYEAGHFTKLVADDDVISRKAAIEALQTLRPTSMIGTGYIRAGMLSECQETLESLPAAAPEIAKTLWVTQAMEWAALHGGEDGVDLIDILEVHFPEITPP